jgi:hypothetical protein
MIMIDFPVIYNGIESMSYVYRTTGEVGMNNSSN